MSDVDDNWESSGHDEIDSSKPPQLPSRRVKIRNQISGGVENLELFAKAFKPTILPSIGRSQLEKAKRDRYLDEILKRAVFKNGQTSEICLETTSKALPTKTYMKDAISRLWILPPGYEFTKDGLVYQWIAEGLIKLEHYEKIIEDICGQCFEALLNSEYIVPIGYDYRIEQRMFKVGDKLSSSQQAQQLDPMFQKDLDNEMNSMAKVEHLCVAFKELDSINFDILKHSSRLKTLILHRCYGSKLECMPADLFMELKSITSLNLSHTDIVELPSSIGNLMELRHLDVSHTRITCLPESICCFSNLLMLNLDGCTSLRSLPKSTSKLVSLHHLIFDVARQLQSMPAGIGKLVNLRTLLAFLVFNNNIGELKEMNNLSGPILISNLEKVRTKEEAIKANLYMKRHLKRIELQWSGLQDKINSNEEEILESLQPHHCIQELTIFYYSGRNLPTWISCSYFSDLVSITLFMCRYLSSLVSFGELPSLKLLKIFGNDEVVEIDSIFCRKQVGKAAAFPKLNSLSFESMSKLESWSGVENGDFPSLQDLTIAYCPKFVHLPMLSPLNSLKHMELHSCFELSQLPKDGLPSTLQRLMISNCPRLKEQCGSMECRDWSKVAHVRTVHIDNDKIYNHRRGSRFVKGKH